MTATMGATAGEVGPYLAAVAARLQGLPATEREELLDDLAAHLVELAAERGSLAERLGSPTAYADDFVASAGVDAREPAPPSLAERVRTSDAVRRAASVAPDLWPGWWVLRALLVAAGAIAVLGSGRLADEPPAIAVAVVLGVLLAVPSVRWGRDASGSWRDRAMTLAGAVAAFVVLASLPGTEYRYVDGGASMGPAGHLVRGDGTPVSNIFAFDRAGNPVEVLLYDQDGRPIDDLATFDPRTGTELLTDLPVDDRGATIGHLFPRRQERLDPTGRGTRQQVPAPAVVLPASTTTPTTASPTTTTTTTAPPAP